MEKIKISILGILALLLCNLFFVACSNDHTYGVKEDVINENIKDNFAARVGNNWISPEMLGVYHNEILEIYLQKYKDDDFTNFIEVYDKVLFEFNLKHPNVLSNEERLYYEERINEVFTGTNTNITPDNYLLIMSSALTAYQTDKLQRFFLPILQDPEPTTSILAKINTFKENNTLTEVEILELDKFAVLLEKSDQFWTNYFIQHPAEAFSRSGRCDPYYQLAIADAAGLMFGGIGSIGMSAFVYALQKDRGGRCI